MTGHGIDEDWFVANWAYQGVLERAATKLVLEGDVQSVLQGSAMHWLALEDLALPQAVRIAGAIESAAKELDREVNSSDAPDHVKRFADSFRELGAFMRRVQSLGVAGSE